METEEIAVINTGEDMPQIKDVNLKVGVSIEQKSRSIAS